MRVICLLFEEVQKVFLFFLPEDIKDTTFSIVKESNILSDVRIPEWEERRLPRQCNSQKGKFITDSSQGFLLQPTQGQKKP